MEAGAGASRHMTRFAVADVEPATALLPTGSAAELLQRRISIQLDAAGGLEQPFVTELDFHPLIAATFAAFSQHRPLTLSPDIIWTVICQGMADHINQHAEKFRDMFVNHAGRQELVVEVNQLDWPEIFGMFSKQIIRSVKGRRAELFRCEFSTTGELERSVQDVCMMSAFRRYFDYVVVCICGIPELRLEGRPDDWSLLRERVEGIPGELELDWWKDELMPICKEFEAAANGDIDRTFWRDICKQEKVYGGIDINGWIIRLIPYLPNRNGGTACANRNWDPVGTNGFPTGLSSAPLSVVVNGQVFPKRVFGGLAGVTQDTATLALRPQLAWGIGDASPLDQAVGSVLKEHESNPPYPADESPIGSADLLQFYQATNGAIIRSGEFHYHLRPIEMIEEFKEDESELPDEDSWRPRESWHRIVDLENGGFYAIQSDPVERKYPEFDWPVAFFEGGNKPQLVAKNFTDLLVEMLSHRRYPFHSDPGFRPILFPPTITEAPREQLEQTDVLIRKLLERGLSGLPVTGDYSRKFDAYQAFPESYWCFLLALNGVTVPLTDTGEQLRFVPLDEFSFLHKEWKGDDRPQFCKLADEQNTIGFYAIAGCNYEPGRSSVIYCNDGIPSGQRPVVAGSFTEFLQLVVDGGQALADRIMNPNAFRKCL